jgi:DNA (cytosine-5)-methyltransferase 1
MLALDRGAAMEWLTARLEELEYSWAYRVVDTRAFGIPQRRRRVLLLASKEDDPRRILLPPDAGRPQRLRRHAHLPRGFYWTEGNTGLGLVIGGIPTLKGGSGLGIPSPPAIWLRDDGQFVTPDLRDAERLQGFEPDWTRPAEHVAKARMRWRLVGNAVSVPVAKWVGERLMTDDAWQGKADEVKLPKGARWPDAAWGHPGGERFSVKRSEYPVQEPMVYLDEFLAFAPHRLSERAASGFYERLVRSSLRSPAGFRVALARYIRRAEMERRRAVPQRSAA